MRVPRGLWALVGLSAGCSWLQPRPTPEPQTTEELRLLRAEVAALRADLATVRADVDLHGEALATLPSGGSAPTVVRVEAPAPALAADLGELDDALADQGERLAQLQLELQALAAVANAHADHLEQIDADVADLEVQTRTLRTLEGVMSFEDGRVVIDGVDVLLKPGVNPDGSPRPAGQILNRAP